MSAQSEQYAVALFELSREQDDLEEIKETFAAFLKSLDEKDMLFFRHPKIKKNEKKDVIRAMDFPALLKDFLFVVIENNRFEILEDIYGSFAALIDKMHRRMAVVVYSKEPLDKKRIQNLKEEYENRYNRKVTLENRTDKTIIGGLRFEFEGMVVDNTVNRTLNQLKSRLKK